MKYYQDIRNGCSMNNYTDNRYSDYNDYSNNYTNEYFSNKNDNEKKCPYCLRKIEETFCCFPSYYNEDKKEYKVDEKHYPIYEGTVKLYPKLDCFDKKDDRCDRNDNINEHKCECRCHNRCGLCGLFRRW